MKKPMKPKSKAKSLMKSNVNITAGDIRSMAGDSGFKEFLSKKGMSVDSLSRNNMVQQYMSYLRSKGN